MKGPKVLNVDEKTGYCGERELAVQLRMSSLQV